MRSILAWLLIQHISAMRLANVSPLTMPGASSLFTPLTGGEMSSLALSAGILDEVEVKLGCQSNFFSFALRGTYRDFVFSNVKRPVLSVNKNSDVMIFSKKLSPQKGLSFAGNFKVRGVSQWKLIREEDFSRIEEGWSNSTVTNCSGIHMLGGYCQFSGGETVKAFTDLPEHDYVRVEATYHFIDAWDSESGYMKLNNGKEGQMEYAWIERYSAFLGSNGINVCGGRWPEGKFSSPIDIVIPHKNNSVTISFGSTLEQDACDQSFGVSGVRIYIR